MRKRRSIGSHYAQCGMRAQLRRLHVPDSPGGDLDRDDFRRSAPFAVLVQAMIGPDGAEGEESFNFQVCSPDWFATQTLDKGFRFTRHVLLIDTRDLSVIQRAIGDLCTRTEGDTWQDVAVSLSRFGAWEFADYRP